jgi:hypothetical protein
VSAAIRDAYFNLTTLLLPGNGTNGAQNNTFLDSSTNNFTITRNGNTTQGTFSPFSQTGWSNLFSNAASSNISAVTGANTSPGTGTFCAELWYYKTDTNNVGLFGNLESNTDTQWGIVCASSTIRFQGWNTVFLSATEPSLNQWHHVAVSRSGTTMSMFVDGIRIATGTVSNNFSATTNIRVGGPNGVGNFNGYISNARFVKGSAVYDPNLLSITVPTTPLTNITNTTFLTSQSNQFIDNGTANGGSGYTITPLNSPSVQPFSPFLPTIPYSAATVGGSGYFDGSGDYLNFTGTNLNLGTGAFTLEGWIYQTTRGYASVIATWTSNAGAGFALSVDNTGLPEFYTGNATSPSVYTLVRGATAIPLNSWVHLAATKTAGSGGTMTLYVNGVSVGTPAATTRSLDQTATVLGRYYANAAGNELFGYLASVRVSNTVRTITVPTAPYTSDGNTLCLFNFTNAGITDATAKNVLETVGNAQISTAVVKYGSGSMYFDGTTDALSMPNSPVLQLGSADFTCEFWAYRLAATNMTWVFLNGNSSNFAALRLDTDTSGNIFLLMSTSGSAWAINTSGSAVLPLSTWTHIAAVRFGGTMRLYVNGVALISTTISGSLTAGTSQQVGANFGATQVVNGYVDDLRLTNGIARYTASFTAPTAAFPLQ